MEYIIGEAVLDAQLVVGEVYADMEANSPFTAFLRFVKSDPQGPKFEWVGGFRGYLKDHEGLCPFNKGGSPWYKTTIKQ